MSRHSKRVVAEDDARGESHRDALNMGHVGKESFKSSARGPPLERSKRCERSLYQLSFSFTLRLLCFLDKTSLQTMTGQENPSVGPPRRKRSTLSSPWVAISAITSTNAASSSRPVESPPPSEGVTSTTIEETCAVSSDAHHTSPSAPPARRFPLSLRRQYAADGPKASEQRSVSEPVAPTKGRLISKLIPDSRRFARKGHTREKQPTEGIPTEEPEKVTVRDKDLRDKEVQRSPPN